MNDIGLEWRRNAYSINPIHIKYIKQNGNNNQTITIFSTDLHVMRIGNSNFDKYYRPGSYGNLQSFKK